MERLIRKPLQGIGHIVQFNWHFYVLALAGLSVLWIVHFFLPEILKPMVWSVGGVAVLAIVSSLAVSFYVYDCSNLYTLAWLPPLPIGADRHFVNIHAGFDETSALLVQSYSTVQLTVLDFYDPAKHTEISIERARNMYPPFPGTQTINTTSIPLDKNSADAIFLILAAHEIRNPEERIAFFAQLRESLAEDGHIIVVEHLRDVYNGMAYTLGVSHFFSKARWKHTFVQAGLYPEQELKITPFVSAFILRKHGITP